MHDEHFLIDTHIFILLFNDRLAENIPIGKMSCSIITEMELRAFPKMTLEEEKFLHERLSGITIYGIDEAIKEKAIHLRRTTRIKLPDAVIVATAVVHNAVLLTNDKSIQNIPERKYRELTLK